MKAKEKEQERGITIVALVITIIVLLILAGIVISMITGSNGILGRSKNSINNYRVAETNENSTMKDYENEIDKIKIDGEGDSEEEVKVNGSSSDWKVNDEGDTIVAYIGGPISSDTMVVPNYVDDKKIVKLGENENNIFANKEDVIQGKKLKIANGIKEIGVAAFNGLKGLTGDLIIPNGVEKIDHAAFMSCSRI